MDFVVGVFAVYAITSILTSFDGPYGVIYKLRKQFRIFECFVCTSVWVAIAVFILKGDITYIFAICGGAMLIERYLTERI